MAKRKVCVVLTIRGNYAKLKSVMECVAAHPDLELQVVVGGAAVLDKYGAIMSTIDNFPFEINHVVHFVVEGENPITMTKSAGLAVLGFADAFDKLKPDVVVVVADRFECLPIAMGAVYMNIPIAHLEGGEVSGSIDESVRHAITKLAHVHFPATDEAAQRIRMLGEDPRSVYMAGCTSFDVIRSLDLADLGPIIEAQGRTGVGARLDLYKPYIVVIQHPVTTEYGENLQNVNATLAAIDALRMQTVWIAPNMDAGADGVSKGLRVFRDSRKPDYIHFFKSLPIELFAPLLKNAACMLGNSSAGIREAAFLGTPTVNVGTRQHGRARGQNVIDVPNDTDAIVAAVKSQVAHGPYPPDPLYGDGFAGKRIAAVLAEHEFRLQKQICY